MDFSTSNKFVHCKKEFSAPDDGTAFLRVTDLEAISGRLGDMDTGKKKNMELFRKLER